LKKIPKFAVCLTFAALLAIPFSSVASAEKLPDNPEFVRILDR